MNKALSQKTESDYTNLRRDLGVFDAMMMGLGSVIGSSVFVSIGVAVGITGLSVVLAAALAAGGVAACNALSFAQLAASYAASGGTYEYGYKYLSPALALRQDGCFCVPKQLQR